jgi:hypothetical protein
VPIGFLHNDVGVDEEEHKRDTVEQLDQNFDAKNPFAEQHLFHAFHRKIAINHGECQGCGEKAEQFCVDQLERKQENREMLNLPIMYGQCDIF